MNDDDDIQNDIQKMNHAPKFLENIFSRIGSRNQNNHEIKDDCAKSDQRWFKAGMKRYKNICETEFYKLMKKKKNCMNHCKNERLQRDPAMEIEALEAQEIFPDSRQSGNRSDENGNIQK